MRLIDLLRMSSSSLKKRKLRTFLTVLGVVIGTASIVVMISLGLGLQKSVYEQVEQSGGVTTIRVSAKEQEGGRLGSKPSDMDEADKYITDEVIKNLKQVKYVEEVAPSLVLPSLLLKGGYMCYIELNAMETDALAKMNIPLKEGGTLPKAGGTTLDVVVGNMVPTGWHEKNSEQSYWNGGEIPDIDMMKTSTFLILDQEAYMNSQSGAKPGVEGIPAEAGGETKKVMPPKKYVVKASGLVTGDINTYSPHSFYVYCDLDVLKQKLKKEYVGRVIPGQPTKKSGKPYPYLTYTTATLKADSMEHVDAVSSTIRGMGYHVESNVEMMNSMKEQMLLIQMVLGGIGAVSLLVAAIGIANTMMMSIYERTKEIGVIKVLGCGLKNIKQIFLLEAAFIGMIGGLVGNILSILMSVVINIVAKSAGSSMGIEGGISYIPPWLALASFVFAIFVGVAAGYFPALRAMRLSPLAAIRNE